MLIRQGQPCLEISLVAPSIAAVATVHIETELKPTDTDRGIRMRSIESLGSTALTERPACGFAVREWTKEYALLCNFKPTALPHTV